jgi:di/tricarboxylate transporter
MGWEAWLAVMTVALTMVALARNYAADIVLLSAVTFIALVQSVTGSSRLPSLSQAFQGFGNEAVLSVAVLFVVVGGLSQTGAMARLTQPVLGQPRSILAAQLRMFFPVAGMSAFLNNTPIVAMFLPVLADWCKKNKLSPSKLYLPLSYVTILGGVCTLLGTSTNMLVSGLWIQSGREPLGIFAITWVGVPVALVGIAYLLLVSRKLLPDRVPPLDLSTDPREYSVEMIVEAGSPLVGKSIEQAGLRNLPALYLLEIERADQIIAAVAHDERLAAGDRLVFVGVVSSVVDLQHIRGLVPASDHLFQLNLPRSERVLVEAVVSNSGPLVGQSVRESRFRSLYQAAVIAVARDGERLRMKIGDIVLQAGDTLLLEARPGFVEQHRDSRDFLLVSKLEGALPPRHHKAGYALLALAAVVALAGFDLVNMLGAALAGAGLMVLFGCINVTEARRSVDWQVIISIGASLGLGRTLEQSGAATALANLFVGAAQNDPWLSLAAIYLVALLLTEILSNNAAAAICFPLAIASALNLGVSPLPFVLVVMVAASCGFATPIGYQTHLMVYGPGGYRFSDFLRIGIPLDLLCGVVAVVVTPFVAPF